MAKQTSDEREDANRFATHGPVEVSSDGFYLRHTDGTPFFYLADTVWNGPLLACDADWNRYLQHRAAAGFTAIQFITHAPWLGCSANAEGEIAFTRDFSAVNPRFFDRIARMTDAINAHGLLAVPVLIWDAPSAGDSWSSGTKLSEKMLIEFARYQVERLGTKHVMWILAGDGSYGGVRAGRWRRIGRAVFAGGKHAPVAMHPRGLEWPYDKFKNEAWLAVAGYQSSHSTNNDTANFIHSGPAGKSWVKKPARVTINLEPCYEDLLMSWHTNQRVSAADVRRAAYWSLLSAPTAGITYGAHGVWSWQEKLAEAFGHVGIGVARPWYEAMQFSGADHMRILGEFFRAIAWWTLRPANLIEPQPFGEPGKFVAAAKNASGTLAAIYFPAGGAIKLHDGQMQKGLSATWCNPRTGERQIARDFTTPDGEDWLLLMTDQKLSTP